MSCFHILPWPSWLFFITLKDEYVLVFKKLPEKISSTAKYRRANKEDEEEKQDKEEEN